MTRVTFGVSASPYLAVRTLQQAAADHEKDHPTASQHILRSFYVDDLLAGAETVEQAVELYSSLRAVLSKGGFNREVALPQYSLRFLVTFRKRSLSNRSLITILPLTQRP